MRDWWKRDTNALKLHEFEKQTRSQFTVWREIFRGSSISRILDFSGFAGTKLRIWISDLTRRNNFSQISCTVFESNKNGSHMVVFVTLFATDFIVVQQCKKRSKCLLDFCWREFVFTGFNYRRSMNNKIPRKFHSTRLLLKYFFFPNIAYSIN